MGSARERLQLARTALDAGFPSGAVSTAYYAALYAARAALSEEDSYAKTHRGVWHLFGELFVSTGRFDSKLLAEMRRVQELREAADYDARELTRDQAEDIVTEAERFVAAVAAMLG
jgi:uncharacterized protein (UPF0332 family)